MNTVSQENRQKTLDFIPPVLQQSAASELNFKKQTPAAATNKNAERRHSLMTQGSTYQTSHIHSSNTTNTPERRKAPRRTLSEAGSEPSMLGAKRRKHAV